MERLARFTKRYSVWIQIALFFVGLEMLGVRGCVDHLREVEEREAAKPNIYRDNNYDRVDFPPEGCESSDTVCYKEWWARREAFRAEVEVIHQQAKQKGPTGYRLMDYWRDWYDINKVEDKYRIDGTRNVVYFTSALKELVFYRDEARLGNPHFLYGADAPTTLELKREIFARDGQLIPEDEKPREPSWWKEPLEWFVSKYLIWALVTLLMFMVRLAASHKFSLKEEFILNPLNLLGHALRWPWHFLGFPEHVTPARYLRFQKLKAYYLRSKPIGYQLTAQEDNALKVRAQQPIKRFDQALEALSGIDFNPQLVRRSLAMGYLSLFVGVVFQPLLATADESAHDDVQSIVHIVDQHAHDQGLSPPQDHHPPKGVIPRHSTHSLPFCGMVRGPVKHATSEFFERIDHIPLPAGCLMESLIL